MKKIKPIQVGEGKWGTKLNLGFWILVVGVILFVFWMALKNGWIGG